MARLSPVSLLSRVQAGLYQDVNDVKMPAQIFTVQMARFEKIDVLADDYYLGVYYDDPLGIHSAFLYLQLPSRANKMLMQAIWDYLNSPNNWPHFVDRSWRQWKDYFLDVGFQEG